MPFHRHLECSSSEDAEQLEAGTIEDAHGSDSAPNEYTMFTSLPSEVDLDSTAHGSFDAFIASLPARNSQFISAKRFRRFMCILKGDTHETDHAQLKRHREKLFNIREFGSKVPDGTRIPFGNWEVHTCVDTHKGKH
jgi:hypothetical protein